MNAIIVNYNQGLLDIALQVYGTADAAPEIAAANDISLYSKLTAGQVLVLPVVATTDANKLVVNYYLNNTLNGNTEYASPNPTIVGQTIIL